MGIDLIVGAKTVVPALKKTFISSVSNNRRYVSYSSSCTANRELDVA